jgi:hypothetical protein
MERCLPFRKVVWIRIIGILDVRKAIMHGFPAVQVRRILMVNEARRNFRKLTPIESCGFPLPEYIASLKIDKLVEHLLRKATVQWRADARKNY